MACPLVAVVAAAVAAVTTGLVPDYASPALVVVVVEAFVVVVARARAHSPSHTHSARVGATATSAVAAARVAIVVATPVGIARTTCMPPHELHRVGTPCVARHSLI